MAKKQPSDNPMTPVRMVIHCPECDEKHIDEGVWATRLHKVHECQHCGELFKVFGCEVYTVGVNKV